MLQILNLKNTQICIFRPRLPSSFPPRPHRITSEPESEANSVSWFYSTYVSVHMITFHFPFLILTNLKDSPQCPVKVKCKVLCRHTYLPLPISWACEDSSATLRTCSLTHSLPLCQWVNRRLHASLRGDVLTGSWSSQDLLERVGRVSRNFKRTPTPRSRTDVQFASVEARRDSATQNDTS